jgi:prepilin-type N-terminal cleavage/methylation domain-containing protein
MIGDYAMPSPQITKRRGFTLTEISITLGIVGFMLAAIWTAAGTVYNTLKVGKAEKQVVAIASSIKALVVTTGQFANLGEITQPLIANNIFPTDMGLASVTDYFHGTASRPVNPWNGYVSVYAMTADTFRVSYYGLPVSACIRLTSAVVHSASNAGLVAVGSWYTALPVGNTPGVPYGADNQLTITPGTVFTPAMAKTMCAGAANNPSVNGKTSAEFDFAVR